MARATSLKLGEASPVGLRVRLYTFVWFRLGVVGTVSVLGVWVGCSGGLLQPASGLEGDALMVGEPIYHNETNAHSIFQV